MWHIQPADATEIAAIALALDLSDTAARLLWLRGYKTPAQALAFRRGSFNIVPFERALPREGPVYHDLRHSPNRLSAVRRALATANTGLVAVYTGDRLPDLGLAQALGDHDVRYWNDRQGIGPVGTLVMWERPKDLAAWSRLRAGVRDAVYLFWEPFSVEPTLSFEWLQAFYRELEGLSHLGWGGIRARSWPATPLMRDAGLMMLVELGALVIAQDAWHLEPLADDVPLEELSAYRIYQASHHFRLLLANGRRAEILSALRTPSDSLDASVELPA